MRGSRTALTEVEQDRIFALAAPRADGKRLSSNRIAAMLGRSPNMVAWFMYLNGLKTPRQARRPLTYARKSGATVRFFTEAEDELILSLRTQGARWPAIAAAVNERFGHSRRPSGIRTRLVMLAGFEAEAEARREAAGAPGLARAA